MLRQRFGEFLCLCIWRRAGCSPKYTGQISMASHPGKSQSDRLAHSPGAARQESQLVSTTAHNSFKTKKKKKKKKKVTNKKRGKTSRINPRQGRSRSASSLISQRCPLSRFIGKASRFPWSGSRRSGWPGAALPADLVGIIPVPMEAAVRFGTLFGYCCLHGVRTSCKQWEELPGCLAASDARASPVHF